MFLNARPDVFIFIKRPALNELSGCGFESRCSHLNFRFRACFEQGVPWHSGNYSVWIHSETRTWHDKNIQSDRKELLIFWTLIVPSLRCVLTQSASLWTRKRFAKHGTGSNPIDIPITWIIMIYPREKKEVM